MKIGFGLMLLVLASVSAAAAGPKNIRVAALCFKSGEQVSGMNKICFYNCMGSQAAITVQSFELCPITIER